MPDYHRRTYFRASQFFCYIRNLSTIRKKIVYMQYLSVACTPSRFETWTFTLLSHCTMALLCHSKRVNGHLPDPIVSLSADVPPSAIVSDAIIAQVSCSHVVLSTSSSANSQYSHCQVHVDVNRKKIKSAKILLNNLEDFAKISTPMLIASRSKTE